MGEIFRRVGMISPISKKAEEYVEKMQNNLLEDGKNNLLDDGKNNLLDDGNIKENILDDGNINNTNNVIQVENLVKQEIDVNSRKVLEERLTTTSTKLYSGEL